MTARFSFSFLKFGFDLYILLSFAFFISEVKISSNLASKLPAFKILNDDASIRYHLNLQSFVKIRNYDFNSHLLIMNRIKHLRSKF